MMKEFFKNPGTRLSYLFTFAFALTLTACCEDPIEPVDNAIMLDGIDDYVDLGSIYNNVELPITISAWVWVDPGSADGPLPIFDSHEGFAFYNGFNLLTSNTSSVTLNLGDGRGENNSMFRKAKTAGFGEITGRWMNLTGVVRGGNDMSLYLNGVDVGGYYEGESPYPLFTDSPEETAKVGLLNQNGATWRFKGLIDEVRIWNRALSDKEVQQSIYARTPSPIDLIGHWDFNEASGTTVKDKSGNLFTGTLIGQPERVLSEVPLK